MKIVRASATRTARLVTASPPTPPHRSRRASVASVHMRAADAGRGPLRVARPWHPFTCSRPWPPPNRRGAQPEAPSNAPRHCVKSELEATCGSVQQRIGDSMIKIIMIMILLSFEALLLFEARNLKPRAGTVAPQFAASFHRALVALYHRHDTRPDHAGSTA